ncbi:hypothetical protein EJ02DRAFT_346161 [Clathrospora elynae]|uniref:Uncharacterized protein n=1 Tax=Clathrospora elynae TaxID=706981 RepID=A0A6A5SUA5_9PLEO|nr:hypothetical protein EJ02DRAFT_346161 [Clathrospora elynae]
MAEPTPPCGQPSLPSSKTTESEIAAGIQKYAKNLGPQPADRAQPASKSVQQPSKARKRHQKVQKLPDNTSISKRPLLHPALPTPFSSSHSPKVLYITASSPYIPALKRIRKLLSEISKRDKQSSASLSRSRGRRGKGPEASGRLEARDVERGIADGVAEKGGGKKGEVVYLKATGRAIPRALEIGLRFQGEEDCWVGVEMGSVCAIDDIEVKSSSRMEDGERKGDASKEVEGEEQDVPETRIRTLSSVTVSIGLK